MSKWLMGTIVCASLLMAQVKSQENSRTSLFNGFNDADNANVSLDTTIELPRDHGPHWPFQIEWWYLTLLLKNEAGEPVNYQFTLFKFARPELASNWGEGYVWMAHSSLHTSDNHYFTEKFAQHGTAVANFKTSPLQFYIDDWQWLSNQDTTLFPAQLTSTAQNARLSISLTAEKDFIKHGEQGVSLKTADGKYRSYYYSQPFVKAKGKITIDGQVNHVSGIGWYDHEWTSQLADENTLGWDWFSLHFNDGRKLMAFTMHVAGSADYSTGTLINAQGEAQTLGTGDLLIQPIKTETVAGRQIPLTWRIRLPEHHIDISTMAFKPNQWNASRFPYYEGAISFSGSHTGQGYMELTGY